MADGRNPSARECAQVKAVYPHKSKRGQRLVHRPCLTSPLVGPMLRGSYPAPFFALLESFLAKNCIRGQAPSEVRCGRCP